MFFLLRAGNVLTDVATATFYCVCNNVMCVGLLLLILCYAIRYAGNPASNHRYKRIIIKTRVLLFILIFTRMVLYPLSHYCVT